MNNLTLGTIVLRLQPRFAVLMALEGAMGMGLITLARRFAAGEFTLADLTLLLKTVLENSGEPVPENLGELVAEAGVAKVASAISQFLAQALSGDSAPKA